MPTAKANVVPDPVLWFRPFDDPSLGHVVRPGVREALESILEDCRHLVECRRDLRINQGQVALSIPCRRQTRQDGLLPTSSRPWRRGSTGVFGAFSVLKALTAS